MANEQNLKPRTALSREEAVALGRAGGIASGKARQQRRLMRETLSVLLTAPVREAEATAALEEAGLPADLQGGIMLAAIKRALGGDVEAMRFIRDSTGEKPRESFDLAVAQKPIRAMDLSALSDEELEALADKADGVPDALPASTEELERLADGGE